VTESIAIYDDTDGVPQCILDRVFQTVKDCTIQDCSASLSVYITGYVDAMLYLTGFDKEAHHKQAAEYVKDIYYRVIEARNGPS